MVLKGPHLSVPHWLCAGCAGKGTLGEAGGRGGRAFLIRSHSPSDQSSLLTALLLTLLNARSTPAESFMFWRQPVLTSCPGNTPFSPRSYMGSHL